jgi:hypothetical protein
MEWDRNGPVHTSIMDSARAHCSPGEKRHARARTCGLATVRSSARSPLPECQERSTTHLRGQSTEALLAPGWSITSSRTPRISHISREIGWIHPTIIVNSSANHRRLLRFSRQTMETVRPGVGAASGSQRTARRRRSKSNLCRQIRAPKKVNLHHVLRRSREPRRTSRFSPVDVHSSIDQGRPKP